MEDLTIRVDITELLGRYLQYFCVELVTEGYVTGEGTMRDNAYNEISELFDDAMDGFLFDDVVSDAIDSLNIKIKNKLFERMGDECSCDREDEIDAEIGVLEGRIKVLGELE